MSCSEVTELGLKVLKSQRNRAVLLHVMYERQGLRDPDWKTDGFKVRTDRQVVGQAFATM